VIGAAVLKSRLRFHMDFLNPFVQQTHLQAVRAAQPILEANHVKERITEAAQRYAQQIANGETVETFDPVPLESEADLVEYCLVLEYLESIGLKFAPTVLRYESQHPNQFSEREELARKLHLRAYDKTPLLVQIIEQKRKYLNKSN
jgi:hypothetical protein